jgi:acetylornithine deacetylase/succinyl-diaminopimelate desuccinylase-like protein
MMNTEIRFRSMTKAASSVCLAAAAILAFNGRLEAQVRSSAPDDLLQELSVKAAIAASKTGEPQTIDDQVRICEVPAPSFKERARGELLRQTFERLGLRNVQVDAAGNVRGDRPGAASRPRIVISAHLDTVFPEGTDVKVKREGTILRGPGIGDDCRGLAVLVGIVRAMRQANVQTTGSITFVATVGEEGLGDLRGVRVLFGVAEPDDRRSASARGSAPGRSADIDRFVSIDGTGLGITNVGVGSIRYRVTFKGPGGHSFSAFGLPNPIGAMGRAIAKVGEFQVPSSPKTTFNVGRVGGGTSINSIPSDAWMEVDMRSPDSPALSALEARFLRAVDAATAEENERWRMAQTVTAVKERVGYRPAAATPADSVIVRTAEAVHKALGLPFTLNESSTDSNIPMSLGIPAITIGGGGRGLAAHSDHESFDTSDSWLGTQRALLLTIALAQN